MSDKGEVVIIRSVIKMLVTCKQGVIKVFVMCYVIMVLMICKW